MEASWAEARRRIRGRRANLGEMLSLSQDFRRRDGETARETQKMFPAATHAFEQARSARRRQGGDKSRLILSEGNPIFVGKSGTNDWILAKVIVLISSTMNRRC
jgi:hypothetical protein